MRSYSSRDVIKILEDEGWYVVRINGSHHIFKNDSKVGFVVVKHPDKNIPTGTLKSIAKQAGITLE